MTGWDTRAQIGLRAPRGINTNINPTQGVVFHYAGGGTHRRSAHSGCRALWRAYQDWHLHPTNANNYNDIAYNLGVCVHDIILEGRSTRNRARVRGGANGNATVNGNRYSICAIWGANDGAPPDSLKRAYLAARAFLRDKGGAGAKIAGHRDMQSTSCPGQPIYNWIRAGAPSPGGSTPPPKPPPTQEDDMPYRDWPKADRDALTADVTRAVWNRKNPTLDLSYGAVLRFVLNALRPDRGQSTSQTVARQVWNYSTDAQPDVRGKMLRQARNGVVALEEMLAAQRPLLEAAAAGQSLSTEEVQAIAEQVSRLRIELHMIDGDDGDDDDVPDSEPDDQ